LSRTAAELSPEVLQAAAREREVRLTTLGRRSGNPHTVTIWIVTDGRRLFIRSGQGMKRDWPQNLVARRSGVLHLGKLDVSVGPRHIDDPVEARATSQLYRRKYGPLVKASKGDQPLTPGEQTTFELLPAQT
jgi:hypothetical protein